MPAWIAWTLPLLLSLASAGALVFQARSWQGLPRIEDERERAYRRTQLRRRMQVSVMLLAVGSGMVGGLFIPQDRRPSLFVAYWCGLMGLVLWVIVLALIDARANYHFWTTSRRRALMEHARLKAEVARREPEKRNGHTAP